MLDLLMAYIQSIGGWQAKKQNSDMHEYLRTLWKIWKRPWCKLVRFKQPDHLDDPEELLKRFFWSYFRLHIVNSDRPCFFFLEIAFFEHEKQNYFYKNAPFQSDIEVQDNPFPAMKNLFHLAINR